MLIESKWNGIHNKYIDHHQQRRACNETRQPTVEFINWNDLKIILSVTGMCYAGLVAKSKIYLTGQDDVRNHWMLKLIECIIYVFDHMPKSYIIIEPFVCSVHWHRFAGLFAIGFKIFAVHFYFFFVLNHSSGCECSIHS